MNKFSSDLIKSMGEACAHAEGKRTGVRIHVFEVPDVRAIRRKLRMSQSEFARKYRIPLPTLKNWEQGRREPELPARILLAVIERHPEAVEDVLHRKDHAPLVRG